MQLQQGPIESRNEHPLQIDFRLPVRITDLDFKEEKHMKDTVRVVILDDHQSIIDGFIYRLSPAKDIKVVDSSLYGDDLVPMLKKNKVDVLLLDLSVPISVDNSSQFPMIFKLKEIAKEFPQIKVIVISTFKARGLVKAAIESGVRGYIFKDDQVSIKQLARIVMIVAGGGNYYSQGAYFDLPDEKTWKQITPRQMEVLTMAAAYPDDSTNELAKRLKISGSTLRNILSNAYTRLGVHTRSAALERIRTLKIYPFYIHPPDLNKVD